MIMLSAVLLLSPVLAQAAEPLPRRGVLGLSFAPLAADQAEKHGLRAGEGLMANAPVPGLTAEKMGFKQGDVIVKLATDAPTSQKLSAMIAGSRAGQEVSFEIIRDGKPLTLKGALLERPRDPGNENYEVVYDQVVVDGKRMRTILTKPRKPGKHPGFFFIQGFSPISYDFTLANAKGDVAGIDGPLLHDFANSGFVTMRVEKPGVGDSEGGPFAQMDFKSEIGIYREALKQLKARPEVDTENVFMFGHSMGGSFGPIVASENPVKGIAVYGVASRTWYEYLVDIMRWQGLVGGSTYEQSDESARQGARLMALVMLEGKSPEDVKKSHPQLAGMVDSLFPGGLFNGKTLDFWRQLNEINFASYWTKLDSHVLAVKGESDFVVYEIDHKLIADMVNRAHPGKGTWKICPDSDHLFHKFDTESDSSRNFSKGEFTMAFSTMMKEWMLGLVGKPGGAER